MSQTLIEPTVADLVNSMTNWQRNQWMRAGQPGAVDGSVEKVQQFLDSLPKRFERHVFTLTKVGDKRVTMPQMLASRTGVNAIWVSQMTNKTAVVEATARMIDRLVRSFHYCLVAEIHQPSGE